MLAQNKPERCSNPYFPLHRDVLCAAVREMLILDGSVDAKTLNIIKKSATYSAPATGLDEQAKTENDENVTSCDTDINIVPPDCSGKCVTSDWYDNAEELVMYIIRQAVEHSSVLHQDTHDDGKEVSLCESYQLKSDVDTAQNYVASPSKRKVSDADETYHNNPKRICQDTSFPSHIVQLARSNVVILNRTSSGKFADAQTPPKLINDSQPAVSDNELDEFLRSPRFYKKQGQQQRNSDSTTLFALPPLLQTSIMNEVQLRKVARRFSESIISSNNLDAALRVFLGYKTTKSVDRNKLISIFSDILFDVSHAMYAWVQTENEMNIRKTGGEVPECTKKNKRVQIPTALRSPADMESIIKQSLFDPRTLKRLGGFEPSSLLPLALGVRNCRINNVLWEDYAISTEGKKAMEVHLQVGLAKNDTFAKKRCYSDALFIVGKRRRGRRGRALKVDKVDENLFAVG